MGLPEASSGAHPIVKLGRYEVVRELGKGAMGIVYLAKDPVIGRLVALKTIRMAEKVEDDETREFQQRFIREAQAAGILNHPAIVTVYELGNDEPTGTTFIAMEFVEGQNLREVLQQGRPLTFDQIGDIVAQIADALDFAHAKGIVHRDVKPANIILLDGLRAKITDFGIAKIASGAANLTSTGQFLGTPNYMAPEQIKGAPVDGRTDIFALGICLYECLTRRKPFGGDSLTAISYKIVHEPFPPLQEINPQIPAAYDEVIGKCLAKDPAKRFQRARDLANAIRAVIKGERPNLQVSESEATMITGSSVEATSAATHAAAARPAAAAPAAPKGPGIWERLHRVPVLGWRVPAAVFIVVTVLLLGGLYATYRAIKARIPTVPVVDVGAETKRKNERELRLQIERYIRAGNNAAAKAKVDEFLRIAPTSPWAISTKAQLDADAGQRAIQAQQVRLAREKYDQGMAYANEEDYGHAIPLLEEAFSINPSDPEIARALQSAKENQAIIEGTRVERPSRTQADDGLTDPTAPARPAPAVPTRPGAGAGSTPPVASAQRSAPGTPAQLTTTFNSPWADGDMEVKIGGNVLVKEYLWEEVGKMMFRRRKPKNVSVSKNFPPGPYDVEVTVRVPTEGINQNRIIPRVSFQPGAGHKITITGDAAAKKVDIKFN